MKGGHPAHQGPPLRTPVLTPAQPSLSITTPPFEEGQNPYSTFQGTRSSEAVKEESKPPVALVPIQPTMTMNSETDVFVHSVPPDAEVARWVDVDVGDECSSDSDEREVTRIERHDTEPVILSRPGEWQPIKDDDPFVITDKLRQVGTLTNVNTQIYLNLAALHIRDCLLGSHFNFLEDQVGLYRWYRSPRIHGVLSTTVWLNFALSLFHSPSPGGNSETAVLNPLLTICEIWCCSVFLTQTVVQYRFMGTEGFLKSKLCVAGAVCSALFAFDLVVMPLFWGNAPFSMSVYANDVVFIRLWLRPAFALIHSHPLRDTCWNMVKTIGLLRHVTLIICMFLVLYAIYGFMLFRNNNTYFVSVQWALYQLLIALTTANFPDVMVQSYAQPWTVTTNTEGPTLDTDNMTWVTRTTIRAIHNNSHAFDFTWLDIERRATPLFFVSFYLVGMYFLLGIAFAVVYRAYRQHLRHRVLRRYTFMEVMLDRSYDYLLLHIEEGYDDFNRRISQLDKETKEIISNPPLSPGGSSPSPSDGNTGDSGLEFAPGERVHNTPPPSGLSGASDGVRSVLRKSTGIRSASQLFTPKGRSRNNTFASGSAPALLGARRSSSKPASLPEKTEGSDFDPLRVTFSDIVEVAAVRVEASPDPTSSPRLETSGERDNLEETAAQMDIQRVESGGSDVSMTVARRMETAQTERLREEVRRFQEAATRRSMRHRGDGFWWGKGHRRRESHDTAAGGYSGVHSTSTRVSKKSGVDLYIFTLLYNELFPPPKRDPSPSPVEPGARVRLMQTVMRNKVVLPRGQYGIVEAVSPQALALGLPAATVSFNGMSHNVTESMIEVIPGGWTRDKHIRALFHALVQDGTSFIDKQQFRSLYPLLQLKVSVQHDIRSWAERNAMLWQWSAVRSTVRFGRSKALQRFVDLCIIGSVIYMTFHFQYIQSKHLLPKDDA
eukprot:Hpha_TRINITY_DN14971_c0_g1::TRINITY_DN14971_c0_g1_i1::g.143891::m.143891